MNAINQTDFSEDLRGETALGQSMINLSYQGEGQRWDVWWLPYFRDRWFSDGDNRYSFSPLLDSDHEVYQGARKGGLQNDYALRWSAGFSGDELGSLDIGVVLFSGIARDPTFIYVLSERDALIAPYYSDVRQVSLDVQWLVNDWLWKLEALHRHGESEEFFATTGGFEYSYVGVAGSVINVGFVAELMRDQRREAANHFFQEDLGLGLRLSLNDAANTEVLVSRIEDLDFGSQIWSFELSRRMGDAWKLDLESTIFHEVAAKDFLYGISRDDFIRLKISRYF